MAWTDKINPEDDKLHPRTDDPWWNESTFITFRVMERNLMGMIYHYFRPNQRTAMGGPWLWDETGADMSVILHFAHDMHMPITDGAELLDWEYPNGMTVETLELQKRIRYSYEGVGCDFDLVYEAAREPCYTKLTDEGLTPGVHDLVKQVPERITTGHYEQYGFLNGVINLRGERIEVVDSFTMRDRSWGPRPLLTSGNKARVGYSSACEDADHSYHIWACSEIPEAEDPVAGTTERIYSGYYVKDGVLGEVIEGTREVPERGADGRPEVEIIDLTDHLGRTLHAEARSTGAVLRWPGVYGDYIFFAVLATVSLNGESAVPGEIQDYMNFRTYSRYMQEHRSRAALMT